MFGMGPGELFITFWAIVIQIGVLVFFAVMAIRHVNALETIARELSTRNNSDAA